MPFRSWASLLVAIVVPGSLLLALWWLVRGRCSATLYTCAHDPMLTRVRDAEGKATPHTIAWECLRCGRPCGVTTLAPSWELLARLCRQAVAKRDERRRKAA